MADQAQPSPGSVSSAVTEAMRIRPSGECGLDLLSLGEVMLRLDPGELRIRTARSFDGLLEKRDLAAAVEYGAAHGALAMTTPGDTSMATLAEVEQLVKGAGARIRR